MTDTAVLSFDVKPNIKRIGILFVRYDELILRCELVLFKKQKLWVRMPEIRIKKELNRFAEWQTKNRSDKFQEKTIKEIEEKFHFNLEKAISVHQNFSEKIKKKNKQKVA